MDRSRAPFFRAFDALAVDDCRRRIGLALGKFPAFHVLLHAIVHAADLQDHDGGVLLMSTLSDMFPGLLKLYAESGYQGPKFQEGMRCVRRQINVEIVKCSDIGEYVLLPKRWVVERTIGWLNRCRRLAKDWECLNRNGLAFLRWASIRMMVRKLCPNRK